jgi:hypothetical protein
LQRGRDVSAVHRLRYNDHARLTHQMKALLTNLKVIGLSIVFIGLIAGLGNQLGWFTHSERLEMVKLIQAEGSIPATATGFMELLHAYPPPSSVNKDAIVRLGTTTSLRSGGYVTPTGPLAYYNINNNRTPLILTFDELKKWATASSYPWFAWVVSAIGFVVTGIGVTNDFRRRGQCTSDAV